jgi:hypothetical protein
MLNLILFPYTYYYFHLRIMEGFHYFTSIVHIYRLQYRRLETKLRMAYRVTKLTVFTTTFFTFQLSSSFMVYA